MTNLVSKLSRFFVDFETGTAFSDTLSGVPDNRPHPPEYSIFVRNFLVKSIQVSEIFNITSPEAKIFENRTV